MAEIWADYRFCSAAWNTAVLQGRCFVSCHDPFPQESDHAKFQQKRLRNGWVLKTVPKKDKFILFFILFFQPIIEPSLTLDLALVWLSLAMAKCLLIWDCVWFCFIVIIIILFQKHQLFLWLLKMRFSQKAIMLVILCTFRTRLV